MAFISKREKDTTAVLIATRGIPDTQTGYRYIPYSQKEHASIMMDKAAVHLIDKVHVDANNAAAAHDD